MLFIKKVSRSTKITNFMKKLLLLLTLFFSTATLFAQANNQVSDLVQCSSSDFAQFDLTTNTSLALANLNPNDFNVTYHESQVDATIGFNSIANSNSYFNIANPQMVFIRIVNIASSEVIIKVFTITVNINPFVPAISYTACDDDNDGLTFIDLGSVSEQIWQNSQGNPNTLTVLFYQTMTDAQIGTNPISEPYFNIIPFQETIYANTTDMTTGCSTVSEVNLLVVNCSTSCPPPSSLATFNTTQTSVSLNWISSGFTSQSSIYITPSGSPAPTDASTAYYAQGSPYELIGLNCDTSYDVYIRTFCNSANLSTWVQTTFSTMACTIQAGQPVNLNSCVESGQACFNLQDNDMLIYGNLNQADFTITYHLSQVDADNDLNVLSSPYCITNGSQVIYARLENNNTQDFQVLPFAVIAQTVFDSVITLQAMEQCDDNNDTTVTFDLTTIQAQINSSNNLEYYTSLANAQNQVVPIENPTTFTVGVQSPITAIFVRDIDVTTCDTIYTFQAYAYSNCNLAYTCSQANSLCNSLGVPFSNTTNISNTGTSGCLFTTPNPTWFYLPVSSAGAIGLMIQQSTDINFGLNNLDVDYIIYGPFSDPVSPCTSGMLPNSIVACSYSAATVEYPVIQNAQPGQFYLLMVTNFSNQNGFIKITELSTTQGQMDCSGIRLNAFLDLNSNGSQDTGEVNFPLGQFTYELNNNGDVHNIISPTGVYNIYDDNASNSYDLSYSIDPNYLANYNITTASYSGISVVVGTGMQTYDFPITVAQTYNDLAVAIVPIDSPRPGFTYQNRIVYTNLGNQTIASGTVTFNKDALVTIIGNTQSGTTVNTGGFSYYFTNMLPFETRSMVVTMLVPNIPIVTLGNYLTNTASIIPLTGDVVPANNTATSSQLIIGSYDPNDKMESRGEQILFSSFSSNDFLYYTIRFENTGTASAINVRVNDVLDAKLEESSLRMVSASHDYIMDRVDNNVTWKFDNIQLPASVPNTNIGKGYVMFRVKPKSGYAVGDVIPNTASIYFDFNPAIITNTFNSEFVAQLAVNEFENGDFVFYPNPVSNVVTVSLKNEGNSIASIAVYDVLGKLIFTQQPSTSITSETIDLSSVSKGMYLLEVTTTTNLKVVKKLIVQ